MVPARAATGNHAGDRTVNTELMLVLNLLATVAGFVGLLLKFESRLTRLETHLEHLLPKGRKFKREVN